MITKTTFMLVADGFSWIALKREADHNPMWENIVSLNRLAVRSSGIT